MTNNAISIIFFIIISFKRRLCKVALRSKLLLLLASTTKRLLCFCSLSGVPFLASYKKSIPASVVCLSLYRKQKKRSCVKQFCSSSFLLTKRLRCLFRRNVLASCSLLFYVKEVGFVTDSAENKIILNQILFINLPLKRSCVL